MNLHEFLRTRRSVRRYTSQPISETVVERILETGRWAPSAHNRQPWRFAVITDEAAKSRLSDAMAAPFRRDLEAERLPKNEIERRLERSRSRVVGASVVVVLCMDVSEMDTYPDSIRQSAERTMAVQSASMAGLQLLLAAHAEGLGAVWNCAPLFAPNSVVTSLGLPDTWEPQGMLLIGIPDEQPAPRPHRTLQEVTVRI